MEKEPTENISPERARAITLGKARTSYADNTEKLYAKPVEGSATPADKTPETPTTTGGSRSLED